MYMVERKNKKKKLYIAVGLGMVLLLAAFFIWNFDNSILDSEESYFSIQLAELADQQVNAINTFFETRYSYMDSMRLAISYRDDPFSTESQNMLTAFSLTKDMDSLLLATTDGSYTTVDGKGGNCSECGFFKRAMNGEEKIIELSVTNDGKEALIIAAPVYQKGETICVLFAQYSIDTLENAIYLSSYSGEGQIFIWNGSGRFFVKPRELKETMPSDNFYDFINKARFRNGFSIAQMKDNIAKGSSGSLVYYSDDGLPRFAAYQKLGIDDWYVMSVMPSEVVTSRTETMSNIGTTLSVEFILLLFIVLIALVLSYRKYNRSIRINLERYHILVEQIANTVFGYDVDNDILEFNDCSRIPFEIPSTIKDPIRYFTQCKCIYEADLPQICKLFSDVCEGASFSSCEFRISGENDKLYWIHASLSSVRNDNGNVIYAVGSLNDITNEKFQEDELKSRAERDPLTKLYNRDFCSLNVNKVLCDRRESSKVHALMLFDIDNFKAINDTYGHQSGDMFLINVAEQVQRIFRSNDIVCRLGGDEFVCFLYDGGNKTIAERKAKQILKIVKEIAHEKFPMLAISCSIGIAFCGTSSSSFDELYKHADKAMYNTKQSGKNGYTIFDNAVNEKKTSLRIVR